MFEAIHVRNRGCRFESRPRRESADLRTSLLASPLIMCQSQPHNKAGQVLKKRFEETLSRAETGDDHGDQDHAC
jgi:hypothetical protein